MPITLDSSLDVFLFSGACILMYEGVGYLFRHVRIGWVKVPKKR